MKTIIFTLILFFVSFSILPSQDFWEPVGNVGGTAFSFTVDSSGSIYAGVYNSIYKSVDNGVTWVKKVAGGGYSNYIWFVLNKQGHIFCGTHSNNLMNSTDNGETWKGVNTLGHPDARPMIFLANGDFIAVPYSGNLHRSVDNGATWTHEPIDTPSVTKIFSFAVAPNNDIFAATDHFIYRSTDNARTWTQLNFDTLCPNIHALLLTKSGDLYAGSNSYKCGIFKSTDFGVTWEKAFIGLDTMAYDYVFHFVESPNGNVYASTNSDGVYVSKDRGKTACKVQQSIPEVAFYWQTFISPAGNLFVGTNKGIYKSIENVTGVVEPQQFIYRNILPEIIKNESFEISMNGKISLDIFDAVGQKIITETGENSLLLNSSTLEKGVYFYVLVNGKNIRNGKFLKD